PLPHRHRQRRRVYASTHLARRRSTPSAHDPATHCRPPSPIARRISMTRWIPATLAAALAVTACRDAMTPGSPGGPRTDLVGGSVQVVPGQYVVALKQDGPGAVGTAGGPPRA